MNTIRLIGSAIIGALTGITGYPVYNGSLNIEGIIVLSLCLILWFMITIYIQLKVE